MEEQQIQTPPESSQPFGGAAASGKGGNKKIVIVAIIAVLLIVLGLIYYYGASTAEIEEPLSQEEAQEIIAQIENEPDAIAESLQQQGESDEIGAIEDDLDATMLDDLDKELEDIDLELNF